jgi:hypothetical protein
MSGKSIFMYQFLSVPHSASCFIFLPLSYSVFLPFPLIPSLPRFKYLLLFPHSLRPSLSLLLSRPPSYPLFLCLPILPFLVLAIYPFHFLPLSSSLLPPSCRLLSSSHLPFFSSLILSFPHSSHLFQLLPLYSSPSIPSLPLVLSHYLSSPHFLSLLCSYPPPLYFSPLVHS